MLVGNFRDIFKILPYYNHGLLRGLQTIYFHFKIHRLERDTHTQVKRASLSVSLELWGAVYRLL